MNHRHTEYVRPDLVVEKMRVSSLSKKNRFTACREVKDWLRESATRHWFFEQDELNKLRIVFCSKQDALMFKLRWH